MMAKNDSQKPMTPAEAHAKLSVILALVKAYRLVELLALFNQLLAIVAVVFAPNMLVKILASLLLLAGLAVFYFALRMRIDGVLFARWDRLEAQALDTAITEINPNYSAGRTLAARLAGAYQLFKRGLYMLILQFALLITLAWFFVQK